MNKKNKRREFGYNGWANYETWSVGVHDYIEFLAESAIDQGELEVDDTWCEDYLYDVLENEMPDEGLCRQLFNGAWSEIDWREIAEHVNEAILEIGI